MGIFNLLKGKPKQEITYDNITSWLESHLEEQEISQKINIFKRELNSKKIKLKELLSELERANLQNEKIIHPREKSIIEGNKKSYIQKAESFAESIKIPSTNEDITEFLSDISEKLTELGHETTKNYAIIKAYMEDQARPIARKLAEIDEIITALRNELEETAVEKINEVKRSLKEYEEKKNEISRLKKDAADIEKQKLDYYDRRGKIELKIKHLQESDSYKDYEELAKKMESLKQQQKAQEDKIKAMFSKISSHLKKYAKDKQDSIAEKYESSPLTALFEDTELLIIESLQKALSHAEELALKPDKKEKLKKEIEEITKEKLTQAKYKIKEIQEELSGLEKRLANHAAHLNMKEQEGWIHSIDQSIEIEQKKKTEIENKLERISLGSIKQKIREKIKEIDQKAEVKI